MLIENPRYITDQGYPHLQVEIDGQTLLFGFEHKATLARHGLVAGVPGACAKLPNGRLLKEVSDNPELFKLVVSFGLACYYGRFEDGPAETKVDPAEFAELGQRLSAFSMEGSPSWDEIGDRLNIPVNW